MTNYLYIFSFGILGISLRFIFNELAVRYFVHPFPTVTFAINMLGSFFIGIVYALGSERGAFSPELRLGLMAGLLGGFTTFSAFSLESLQLIQQTRYVQAAAQVFFQLIFSA